MTVKHILQLWLNIGVYHIVFAYFVVDFVYKYHKRIVKSSFTHLQVVSNLYDFVESRRFVFHTVNVSVGESYF